MSVPYEDFCTPRKMFSAVFLKLKCTCQGECFARNIEIFKNSFWGPSGKNLCILIKIVRQGWQNCVLCVPRNNLKKFISLTKIVIFVNFSGLQTNIFLSFYREIYRHGCQHYILFLPNDHFEEMNFFGKLLFC